GVLISRVEGSAATLGIQPGDLVTRVGDIEPESPMDFLDAFRGVEVGEYVEIEIERDGETLSFEVPTEVPQRDEPEQERL
ncbi:PDZ domain-containing protein, partial [Natronospira sp.]